MTTTVIHSATVVTAGTAETDSWVAIENDRIAARGRADSWRRHLAQLTGDPWQPGDPTIIDADGSWLTPGFIDLHCHGGSGVSFDGAATGATAPVRDGIAAALDAHRRAGTTRSMLSLVTAERGHLRTQVTALAPVVNEDPLLLGIHLEGPFLARQWRGAHAPELLRTPDQESVSDLLRAADGSLGQVTLAPELEGSATAIRSLREAGVIVAVGHTGADYDTAMAAFDAGASVLTHAFNGMPGLHHRSPGPVLAAAHHPDVVLEAICDGVHLDPGIVRLLFDIAPGRVALITDAMAAAGVGDGHYRLGAADVLVEDGTARVVPGGSIAGSTLVQNMALATAVAAGVPVESAVMALTAVPARAVGREQDLGRIEAGYLADLVLLDRSFGVQQVWAAGVEYSSPA